MRNPTVLLAAAALAAGTAAQLAATPKAESHGGGSAAQRGQYLVTVLACGDCHTPKKMGPKGPEPNTTKLLAGYVEEKLPPPPAPNGPWIAHTTGQMTAWAGP